MKRTWRFVSVLAGVAMFAAPAAMLPQRPISHLQGSYFLQDRDDQRDHDQRDHEYREHEYREHEYREHARGGWDAPPLDYTRDLQRAAFRDGVEGARHDAENRRQPNVFNRDEFRNYRGPARQLYRQSFATGYQVFWQHQGFGPRTY